MRRHATPVTVTLVAAVIVFGVHKSEQDTQARLNEAAHANAVLTYKLCSARNLGVAAGNARWSKMSGFIRAAAALSATKAETDPPLVARLDAHYAVQWRRFADSIELQPTTKCGARP